jgi:hypothetical protein
VLWYAWCRKDAFGGRYSRWDIVKQIDPWREVRGVSMEALTGLNTIFYTPPIINTPRQIEDDIQRLRDRAFMSSCVSLLLLIRGFA